MSTVSRSRTLGLWIFAALGVAVLAWLALGEAHTGHPVATDAALAGTPRDVQRPVAPASAPVRPVAEPIPATASAPVVRPEPMPRPEPDRATTAVLVAWVASSEDDYDAVLALIPDESAPFAREVLDASRATLGKLIAAVSRGDIGADAAVAAVDHQRLVVARRLSGHVSMDVATEIAVMLGTTLPEPPPEDGEDELE